MHILKQQDIFCYIFMHSVSVCFSLSFSLSLSVCLSVYLSIYLSILSRTAPPPPYVGGYQAVPKQV